MTTDYVGAQDAMNAAVYAEWKAATIAIVGSQQKMFFQGIVKGNALETGQPFEYWARVSIQTVNQPQTALAGADTTKRHTATGLLFVQMFFPWSVADSWRKGSAIANRVKNVLARRTPSGTVWFRNPRINELTADGTHHRLNVVAEFEYDESV